MIATETAPQSIVRCLGPCGAENSSQLFRYSICSDYFLSLGFFGFRYCCVPSEVQVEVAEVSLSTLESQCVAKQISSSAPTMGVERIRVFDFVVVFSRRHRHRHRHRAGPWLVSRAVGRRFAYLGAGNYYLILTPQFPNKCCFLILSESSCSLSMTPKKS